MAISSFDHVLNKLNSAENGSLKEKDTTTATAARNEQVSFNHFQDWANEKKEKMQCCGEYPERFPYQPKTGKACCNGISYNSYVLECCHGAVWLLLVYKNEQFSSVSSFKRYRLCRG